MTPPGDARKSGSLFATPRRPPRGFARRIRIESGAALEIRGGKAGPLVLLVAQVGAYFRNTAVSVARDSLHGFLRHGGLRIILSTPAQKF